MTIRPIFYHILLPFFPIVFYMSLDLLIVELIVLALTVLITIICVYGFKIQIVPTKVHNMLHVIAIPIVIVWLVMNWVNDKDNIQTVETENTVQMVSESDEPTPEPEVMYDVSSKNKMPTMNVNVYENKDDKLMKQGIWYDKTTGLYWDRCSVGQKWDGETCQGEPLELNWQDAQDYVAKFTNEKAKGGYTDWRVPTIEELASIRYCSNGWKKEDTGQTELTEQGRQKIYQIVTTTIPTNGGTKKVPRWCADGSNRPALDTHVFPNSQSSFYWSSSAYANLNNHAWGVYFSYGGDNGYYKDASHYVRAVRSD